MTIASPTRNWRDRFAGAIGILEDRKPEIYLDISRAATVRDASYWLQLMFAAGVATMGLVLSSPAVIIGAMLISPLMGPILSTGLSLATGDLVLGIRSVFNLFLSCLLGVVFSFALVTVLPFREMTAEIASRTQPNTLDLVVALFSGAIGAIAVCREVKGVITSIPGVAIAVALMPPLCVVGYGLGLALTYDSGEGIRVARGGGLLFLTNLVAISFTSMMVFLGLHLDTRTVREKVREWRRTDAESAWVRHKLGHYRVTEKLGAIGGLPGRLIVIMVPLILILIPLSISLAQLKQEIQQKQSENRIRKTTIDIWQQYFATLGSGEARSFIDQLIIKTSGEKLEVSLRVFDNQTYSESEKSEFTRLLGAALGMPASMIDLQLIEIPTSSAMMTLKKKQEQRVELPPSVAVLRSDYRKAVESAMRGLRLPPAAGLVDYRIVSRKAGAARIELVYLSRQEIESDARELIAGEIRSRLLDPSAEVLFDWLPADFASISFQRRSSSLDVQGRETVDRLVNLMADYPDLKVEIAVRSVPDRNRQLNEERARSVADAIGAGKHVEQDRIVMVKNDLAGDSVDLKLVRPD